MSFEQLFQDIRNDTFRMSATLDSIKSDTRRTLDLTEQQASATQENAEAIRVEQARNNADVVPEVIETAAAPVMGETDKLVDILEEIRDLLDEEGEGGGLLGDLKGMAKGLGLKLPGMGKQTGGFVYPSPTQAFQSGGGVFQVPGNSTGDNHNMLLPQGSFVLNRNASKALLKQEGGMIPPPMSAPLGFQEGNMVPVKTESQEMVFGPGSWSSLIPVLNSVIPRFQGGGIVEHLHGDPTRKKGYDYAGHGTEANAHDHFAFSSAELRQQVQDMLASGQTKSGRAYQIGSTTGGKHADTSYHYTGQAFDIPWSQFGSGPLNEKDYKQSQTLLADVKDIVARINGNGGASAQPSGGGGSATTPAPMQQPTMTVSDLLGNNPFEGGRHNDAHAEYFPGYTSDMHSSGNSKYARNISGGDDGFVGSALNAIGGILSGGLGGIFTLLTGGIGAFFGANNEQGQNIFGQAGQAMSDAVGGLLGFNDPVGATTVPEGVGTTSSLNDPTARALLDAIAKAEGTTKSYGTMFGGQVNQDLAAGNLTVGEAMQLSYNNPGSSATGRYQFMQQTFKDLINAGVWKKDEKLTPELQDRGAMWLIEKKRGVDLSDGLSQKEVQKLSWEWASIKGNNYTYQGRAQGRIGQSDFMNWVEKGGGTIQGKQQGGAVGLEPVKVESGELIFPPGSYGSEIPALNKSIPRFQGGGMTGSLGIAGTDVQNFVSSRFSSANVSHNEMAQEQSQPVVIPMPVGPSSGGDDGGYAGGGAPIPSLTSAPSNHIVSSLMMSSYSLMQRIG